MNVQQFISTLSSAIEEAARLDEQQQHDDAAAVLRDALGSDCPWTGTETDEELEEVRLLANRCARGEERQRLRAARLRAYLAF